MVCLCDDALASFSIELGVDDEHPPPKDGPVAEAEDTEWDYDFDRAVPESHAASCVRCGVQRIVKDLLTS